MRTSKISRLASTSVLAIVILAAASGCKSTSWKMPGSKFFASRQAPDASILAGTNNASLVEMPESPAGKYTPGTIASVGARPDASNYAAGNTSTNTYGYTAQTVATPQAGLAAQANGYQTGPYGLTAGAQTPPSSLASSGLPNPYGGTYSGKTAASSAQAPNIALPTSVNQALAGSNAAGPAGPNFGLPSATGTQTSIPVGYPTLSSNVGSASASAPAYPSSTQGLPAYPSLPPITPSGSSYVPPMPSAYQGASTPSFPPAIPSGDASQVKSYSPGTTGRSTTYDFSGAMNSSTTPLPPNTASGTNPLLR